MAAQRFETQFFITLISFCCCSFACSRRTLVPSRALMVQDNTPKLAVGSALFRTTFFWSSSKHSEGPTKCSKNGQNTGPLKHNSAVIYIQCSEGPSVIPDSFALTAFWMNCARVWLHLDWIAFIRFCSTIDFLPFRSICQTFTLQPPTQSHSALVHRGVTLF